jgi:hypothetical protein
MHDVTWQWRAPSIDWRSCCWILVLLVQSGSSIPSAVTDHSYSTTTSTTSSREPKSSFSNAVRIYGISYLAGYYLAGVVVLVSVGSNTTSMLVSRGAGSHSSRNQDPRWKQWCQCSADSHILPLTEVKALNLKLGAVQAHASGHVESWNMNFNCKRQYGCTTEDVSVATANWY